MDEYMISETISKKMWVAKALAIFCVSAGHSSVFYDRSVGTLLYYANRSLRWKGLIAVPVFFVLAGLFYVRKPGDSKEFWKKKWRSVVIPWLFCGSMIYLYEVITNGYLFTLKTWILWLLGTETWLYFVPVLLECFVICKFAGKLWQNLLLLVLSFISYGLTACGLLEQFEWYMPQMNPFNWLLFFLIGKMIREYLDLEKFDEWIGARRHIICLIFICMLIFWYVFDIECAKWSLIALPFQIMGFCFIYAISGFLWKNSFLVDIGKISFSFYLLHTTLLGKLNTSLPENFLICFLKPAIVLVIVYVVLKAACMICDRLKCKWCLKLIGIR